MKRLDSLTETELSGKRVLVRADFNVPLAKDGSVAEPFRLTRGWQSIRSLQEKGAKTIIISHIGRDPKETLAPVAEALKSFGRVVYISDITGIAAQNAVAAMKPGEIVLLENLRRDPRETENDESFAKELASLAEIYVDDAFSAAHREHASIVGVPKFIPGYAGILMCEEVAQLDKARSPGHPSFAILGGAKFETKAPLIKLLLEKYDHLFVTGALANDVFKAEGFPIGRSLISKESPTPEVLQHPHFIAPVDVTVEQLDGQARTKKPNEVLEGDKIVDIGPDTIAAIAPLLTETKFILWNGPTGLYEGGYTQWTHAIAHLIAEAAGRGAQSVIGGGDTIAAIQDAGIPEDKLGFLSTGGGAMLEYLLQGTLPGIEALN